MNQRSKMDRLFSRREFLMGIPLGIGGAFALSSLSDRLFGFWTRRREPPEFPEDSIFKPAKDRRTQT
jgi:hypothetical protein